MTDRPLPAAQTIETVVHSFTQAELALTEVTGAVAKFRTASEQLFAAEAANAAATDALRTATAASAVLGAQLGAVVSNLGEVVAALKAVDPDRLWAHLERTEQRQEAIERQRITDNAAAERRSLVMHRVAAVAAVKRQEAIEWQRITDNAAAERRSLVMLRVAAVAAVSGVVSIVLLLLVSTGALPK